MRLIKCKASLPQRNSRQTRAFPGLRFTGNLRLPQFDSAELVFAYPKKGMKDRVFHLMAALGGCSLRGSLGLGRPKGRVAYPSEPGIVEVLRAHVLNGMGGEMRLPRS